MNIENKIRDLLESVDEKTPAQMSYPGATGPQDPAPYMGVNFEELELDRPGVVSDEIQQVQYPGQTMPDPMNLGPEYQELDPYNMAPTIQEVPKENYPIGSGADDVQSPQDPAASMQPDEYSAGITPAQHPAPFVAEAIETSYGKPVSGYHVKGSVGDKEFGIKLDPTTDHHEQVKAQNKHLSNKEVSAVVSHLNKNVGEKVGFSSNHGGLSVTTSHVKKLNEEAEEAVPSKYQSYKPAKVSAKAQGQHIVVLDKNTASAIEKKLGLPKGALSPVQGGRYSETVVVKGKDNKLHTVYAKDDTVRTRSYGHDDQASTQALADHLNEALDVGQQQVDPVDQQNEVLQQAVQAVQAGNKIEDVAKATGLDAQAIQAAIEAAQPTASPAAPQSVAPVSEEVDMGQADSSLNRTLSNPSQKMDWTVALTNAAKKMGYSHYMDVPEEKTKELHKTAHEFRALVSESSLKQDVESILGEETLSEEFKSKAAALFESTVVSRVNEEVKRLEEAYDSKLSAEIQSLQEQYVQAVETFAEKQSTRLNSYINYLGEQWIKQNRVALHQGIRTDLTEGFMKGLQKLFTEHYINVPTEKVDLVAEQKAEIQKLQESITEMESKVETLEESNHILKREAVIMKVSEGLTDTEAAKLNSLCEGVSFESEDLFESKINMIKNNFFKRKAAPSPEQLLESTIQNTQQDEDKKVAIASPNMERYIAALNKFKQ